MMEDSLAHFLGVLGAIEAAAVLGYGKPGITLDVYPSYRHAPDEHPGLRIRLIGEWREGTPKAVARRDHHWEWEISARDLTQMTVDALPYLLAKVEAGAGQLAAAEGRTAAVIA